MVAESQCFMETHIVTLNLMKIILSIIFTLIGWSISAQTNIDSLIRVVATLSGEDEKIEIWKDIADYYLDYDDDQCLLYCDSILTLAAQIKDNSAKAYAYYYKAIINNTRKDNLTALELLGRAQEIYSKLKDSIYLAKTYNMYGNVYLELNLFEKATDNFLTCIKMSEQLHDDRMVYMGYGNLGVLFFTLENYLKAQYYFEESLKIQEQLQDYSRHAQTYHSLGNCIAKTESSKAALFYFEKGLSYALRDSNYSDLVYLYNGIGSNYSDTGEKEKAKIYIHQSIYYSKLIQDIENTGISYANLASIFMEENQVDSFHYYNGKALEIAQANSLEYLELSVQKTNTDFYADQYQMNKAFESLSKVIELRDTLAKKEIQNQMLINTDQFQLERKERQIAEQQLELAQSRVIQDRVVLIAVLIIGLMTVVYQWYLRRQQKRKQAAELALTQQQAEATRLRELDELKTNFFTNISHELRTPLTLILSPLADLQEQVKAVPVREKLGIIKSNAGRLLSLVNEIMDLAKVEAGKLELQKSRVALQQMVKRIFYSYGAASDTAFVAADFAIPDADAGLDHLINCFSPDALLSGGGSSTGPNFNFDWTDELGSSIGSNTDLQVSAAGTYFLEILNTTNGCINQDSVEVTADFEFPDAEAGADQVLNCYDPQLTLSGVGSSIGPDFNYEWTNQIGTNLGADLFLTIAQDGNYYFTVTNQTNGCATTDSTFVDTNFDTPAADAGNPFVLNCLMPEGTLDGSNSDIGPLIEYEWTNSTGNSIGTLSQLTIQSDGTYYIEVTNTLSGCTSLDSVLITADFDFPIAEAGADELINCTTPALSLDGSNSSAGLVFNYEWQDEMGTVLGTTTDQMISQSGYYYLTVLNTANGCSSLDSVFVDENFQFPIAEAGDPQILNCFQPNLNLDGSNSSSGLSIQFTWTDDQAIVIGNAVSQNIAASGWYFLEVLDNSNGCSSIDSVLIGEDFVDPTAIAGMDGLLNCSDPSFTLDGSASSSGINFEYEWTNQNGMPLGASNMLNINTPGTYILTVFNNVNGCSAADTAVVNTDQVFPVAQVFTNDLLTCIQLEALLNTQGSSAGLEYDYLWSTLSGTGLVQQGPNGPFVQQPGLYELVVLNTDNGCSDTTTVQVDQNIVPPSADAGATIHLNCFQETGALDGSQSTPLGQLTYSWMTTDGQFISADDIANPNVSASGTYTLTVTDIQNGCTDIASVTVTSSFLQNLDAAITPPICYGETGFLEITNTTGGLPPYLYAIDGGETYSTQTLYSNLEAGVYEISVQDADGCTLDETVEIISPPAIDAFTDPVITILLGEEDQLFLQTTLSEGQIDSIQWSPATYLSCTDCPDPIITPLENIRYEVVVIDTAGCEARSLTDVIVDGRSRVYIPNAFSPDGDGQNEVFMIFAATDHVQTIRAFQVFNRWGEEVHAAFNFQPNDPIYGWNGEFRGQPLDPAVFVYYAEVELIDGRVELFKGDVILVK